MCEGPGGGRQERARLAWERWEGDGAHAQEMCWARVGSQNPLPGPSAFSFLACSAPPGGRGGGRPRPSGANGRLDLREKE